MSRSNGALVVFDLDGTLLRGPTVCEMLARSLNRLPRMQEFERLKDREGISAARKEMALWYRGTSRSMLLETLHDAQLMPGFPSPKLASRSSLDLLASVAIAPPSSIPMPTSTWFELDPSSCYRALSARDARFDGVFFVGVVSTGVYCRPVCRARLPKADHCRYFGSAARAESAGFRPCLRCCPERAPGRALVDATNRVAALAVARIAAGALNNASVERLASELHVGARQLRRAVVREFGVSPVQLAQTYRLSLAKRLLSETTLPLSQVGYASGFKSTRRFNSSIRAAYGVNPGVLRKGETNLKQDCFTLSLQFRRPYDWHSAVEFLKARATPGTEHFDGARYVRTIRFGDHRGWFSVEHGSEGDDHLMVTVSHSLTSVLMLLVNRVRHLFDLDAEPDLVASHLGGDPALRQDVEARPGLRVPGSVDGFELAMRAVLGQQVSVAAATTVCGRLTDALASPAILEEQSLCRYPLSPEEVLGAGADRLQALGLPRKRAECIIHLARACSDGRLRLEPGADVEATLLTLESLPGIGPWTSQYIAMRALHWPDAFPEQDLALRKAWQGKDLRPLRHAAQSWRPWRSYAAMYLWKRLSGIRSLTASSRTLPIHSEIRP